VRFLGEAFLRLAWPLHIDVLTANADSINLAACRSNVRGPDSDRDLGDNAHPPRFGVGPERFIGLIGPDTMSGNDNRGTFRAAMSHDHLFADW
jgi:hypothetical protein